MGTIKDYLQPSPIEKYFAHRDMWEKIFSINERVLNQNLMMSLASLQTAIQPYWKSMIIAQSANNAIIANKLSLDRVANGFEQLQQVHKYMQPMAEYQAILQEFTNSISLHPISESINLSELDLEFFSDSIDVSFDSLSDEEYAAVDEISRDNKLISYLKSKYHQFKAMPPEKVALHLWINYIRPVIIGLITAYLSK